MDLSTLVSKLSSQYHNPFFELPGENAQDKMSPIGRKELVKTMNVEYRQSAVMIFLYPSEALQAKLVVIRRRLSGGVHSGQISLPGGRYEEEDKNLFQTAVRETHEEIGFELDTEKMIGGLSKLLIPVSGYEVQPVIGYTDEMPMFTPQEEEVDTIIEIDVEELLHCEPVIKQFKGASGFRIEAPCYQINETIIWGATAMILSEFLEVIR